MSLKELLRSTHPDNLRLIRAFILFIVSIRANRRDK